MLTKINCQKNSATFCYELNYSTIAGKSTNLVNDKEHYHKTRCNSVPFEHGTLQIGIFSQVLYGNEDWEGQRCGIQVNIKRDFLKHFIKYGATHYNKYRYSGYPQGPIVFFFFK